MLVKKPAKSEKLDQRVCLTLTYDEYGEITGMADAQQWDRSSYLRGCIKAYMPMISMEDVQRMHIRRYDNPKKTQLQIVISPSMRDELNVMCDRLRDFQPDIMGVQMSVMAALIALYAVRKEKESLNMEEN